MKTADITPKSAPAIILCAVAGLFLSLAFAQPAAAWISDSGWGGSYGYGYDDYDADEDREWSQEASREAAREKRRDELEAKREKDSAEHDAYFAAVVSQSKASMNAPTGVYYRKPGWSSTDPPPATSQSVAAGQVFLFYDNGIFWFQRGNDYIVVVPPFGVVVDTLPPGVRAQPSKDGTLYYFFGTFYKGKDGKYVVVKPPPGTIVGYLPDGYSEESSKDTKVYRFGELSYKQAFLAGVLVYQVI